MKAYVVLLSGLLLMTPAAAQTSDSDSGSQQPAQSGGNAGNQDEDSRANPNRRICRKVETNTGSRVPFRRLCLTERKWEAYRREN